MKKNLIYIFLILLLAGGIFIFFCYKDTIMEKITTKNKVVDESNTDNNNLNNDIDTTEAEEAVEKEENEEVNIADDNPTVDDEAVENSNNIEEQQNSSNIEEENEKEISYNFSNISTYKSEFDERYINYKKEHLDLSDEEIVKRVNVYIDYKFYEHDIVSINKYTSLVLVNKYFYLDENYIPNNLIKININCASSSSLYGESEAVSNFESMCLAAKEEGLTIKAMSTYRSYASQSAIYNNYLKSDTQASVDTYSARPGHSEHQTGLAFDVYNGVVSFTSFGTTNEYRWVKNNAYKYGFIIRYTEANSYITGYSSEPWHLRYVGVEAATYIYNNNITLEEYLLNR